MQVLLSNPTIIIEIIHILSILTIYPSIYCRFRQFTYPYIVDFDNTYDRHFTHSYIVDFDN
ncbi:hypothetical protein GIB67_005051, partial [Kingdonia uniflora]